MRAQFLGAALLSAGSLGAGATDFLEEQAKRIHTARQTYDLEAAKDTLQALRTPSIQASGDRGDRVRVEAALLVAELERIDFEETPTEEQSLRREIGERIDAAAQEGLDLLADLGETSETQRIRADLVGTLIRSKFRGQKYRSRMESAAARALELDRSNARAWVSSAKPDLLRPGRGPKDLERGLELVNHALEIDSSLEPALLLRGRALFELGRSEDARADWQRALELNPSCRLARDWLSEL